MAQKQLAKKPRRASSSSSRILSKKSLQQAGRLPAVENKHSVERGHSITYELRPVLCGKPGCKRHHGPYWYAYWTQGGRVRTVYIGKSFRKVEDKCPERLRSGFPF
jgi:hypothetical protein